MSGLSEEVNPYEPSTCVGIHMSRGFTFTMIFIAILMSFVLGGAVGYEVAMFDYYARHPVVNANK